jgi:hypothetical protein
MSVNFPMFSSIDKKDQLSKNSVTINIIPKQFTLMYNTFILPTSGDACVGQIGMVTKFLEVFNLLPTIVFSGSGGSIASHIMDLNDWDPVQIKNYLDNYKGNFDIFTSWNLCYLESCWKKSVYNHGQWCKNTAITLCKKGLMKTEIITAITKEKDDTTLIISNRTKNNSLISDVKINAEDNLSLIHDTISFLDSKKMDDNNYVQKRLQFTLEGTSSIPILSSPIKPPKAILDPAIEDTTYVDAAISALTPFSLLIDNLPTKLKSRIFYFSYETIDNKYQSSNFLSQIIHVVHSYEHFTEMDEQRKIMENIANNKSITTLSFTSEELSESNVITTLSNKVSNKISKIQQLKDIFSSSKSFVAEFRLRITGKSLPYIDISEENVKDSFNDGYQHFNIIIYLQEEYNKQ